MAFSNTFDSLKDVVTDPVVNTLNELTITNNTVTIDSTVGSYFEIKDISDNLNIVFKSIPASALSDCYTIYLKLSFTKDDIVISWPNNIKWYEISPPIVSSYEDLYIQFNTFDNGVTWLCNPLTKTKPLVDLSNYMSNNYPATKASITELPPEAESYFSSVRPISCSSLMDGCSSLTSLDLSNLNTSSVTNMSNMFYQCSSLTSINLTTLDTSNVTNMSDMFNGCSSLRSIYLSNWDTSNVTNMYRMFNGCSSLTSIDLSNWDTSNVTNIGSMFTSCSNLMTVDMSNFDTSNTSAINYMFNSSNKMTNLILGGETFKFNKDPSGLKGNCKIIVPENLLTTYRSHSAWTSRKNYIYPIEGFEITRSNGTVDVAIEWDTILEDELEWPMYNWVKEYYPATYSSMTTIDSNGQDFLENVNGVFTTAYMFDGCSSLTTVDLSDCSFNAINDTSYMFNGCSNLTSVDISGLDFSSVTNASNMFNGVSIPNGITVTGTKVNNTIAAIIGQKASNSTAKDLDTSTVTNMSGLFQNNTRLTSLDLTDWDTSAVTNTSNMFNGCSNLTSLDISGLDFSSVTNASNMFNDTSSLSTLNVSNVKLSNDIASKICQKASTGISSLDVSTVTNADSMFYENQNLTSVDMTDWDTSSMTDVYLMFTGCSNLTSVNMSGLDFSSLTHIGFFHEDAYEDYSTEQWVVNALAPTNLEYIDLSNTNFDGLETITGSEFENLTNLKGVNFSNASFKNVTTLCQYYQDLFNGLSELLYVDFSNVDLSSVVTSGGDLFDSCAKLESVILPKMSKLSWMFQRCSSLKVVDASNVTGTSRYSMFNDCAPQYLIINSETVDLKRNDEFKYGENVKILVPSSALNAYKTDSTWSPIADKFDAIENYTITKSNGILTVTPNT